MTKPWKKFGDRQHSDPADVAAPDGPTDFTPTSDDLRAAYGLPPSGTIECLLEVSFRLVAAAEQQDPIWNTALAVRCFLAAAAGHAHRSASFDPITILEAMENAAPALRQAVGDAMPWQQIDDGVRLFREFVEILAAGQPSGETPDAFAERLDRLALFANELDALHRRRATARRGAALARANAIQYAARAPAPAVRH